MMLEPRGRRRVRGLSSSLVSNPFEVQPLSGASSGRVLGKLRGALW
jgi:hypothetical protein